MTPHPPHPYEPTVPPDARLPELSARALILGTVLGMVFGASSLYLVLKVGLTVSASIPVSVISITLFRLAANLGLKDATILENNVVQTAGSAGESIAFGVGVTMPAIMILGFDLEITRVMLVSVLGGLLGILMMIPLRRALIVAQHGVLKYPEGTACAEVLKAGASGDSNARTIFSGFGLGLVYKTAMSAFKLWKDTPQKVFSAPFKAGSLSAEISPELLGVGYIIGPRISGIMCAGGVLAYLVLIPMIKFFGDPIEGVLPPGTLPIRDMGPGQIRQAYILYIGAGAVTAGGLVSLVRSLPTIYHGLRAGLADVRGGSLREGRVARTDQDLSLKLVAILAVLLLAAITFAPQLHMNLLGSLLIALFGFLFVTVSSRLTGEIGSSSNPISGMTVATLLLTCLVFLALGWTGRPYYVTALSVGAIVCIAASNGGTTSQDLKTGFLVGATPKLQQVAILVGALASALLLGPILLRLNDAATVYVPASQVAPAGLVAPMTELGPDEALRGPQAAGDPGRYASYYNSDSSVAPEGRYLVERETGKAVWLVDPGINGVHDTRPDGSKVRKFDAPKATLMSYIIKGILDQQLPWGLVLFGVMIALTLELSGIGSLAFAVGVYLPLSSTSPILLGGLIRWLADRKNQDSKNQDKDGADRAAQTEEERAAESDRSPGVLMSSGYIAGGAIAGIIIAFVAGLLDQTDRALTDWATRSNPFFEGPMSDGLALIPFTVIAVVLYLVARGKLLSPR